MTTPISNFIDGAAEENEDWVLLAVEEAAVGVQRLQLGSDQFFDEEVIVVDSTDGHEEEGEDGRKGVQGAQPGPVLTRHQRVKVDVGAAKELEYLHEKADPHIIHRDIKSSNVLNFDDDVAKIADFDLSNQAPDMAARLHSTRVLGTFGYHAPEKQHFNDQYLRNVLLQRKQHFNDQYLTNVLLKINPKVKCAQILVEAGATVDAGTTSNREKTPPQKKSAFTYLDEYFAKGDGKRYPLIGKTVKILKGIYEGRHAKIRQVMPGDSLLLELENEGIFQIETRLISVID